MFRSALVFANSSSSVFLWPDAAPSGPPLLCNFSSRRVVRCLAAFGRKEAPRAGHSCLICKPNIGRACLFSDITQNFDIEVRSIPLTRVWSTPVYRCDVLRRLHRGQGQCQMMSAERKLPFYLRRGTSTQVYMSSRHSWRRRRRRYGGEHFVNRGQKSNGTWVFEAAEFIRGHLRLFGGRLKAIWRPKKPR